MCSSAKVLMKTVNGTDQSVNALLQMQVFFTACYNDEELYATAETAYLQC